MTHEEIRNILEEFPPFQLVRVSLQPSDLNYITVIKGKFRPLAQQFLVDDNVWEFVEEQTPTSEGFGKPLVGEYIISIEATTHQQDFTPH